MLRDKHDIHEQAVSKKELHGMNKLKRFAKRTLLTSLIIQIIGFLLPHPKHMPVKGASNADYHSESFWYYPWGKSVTHKGVDIFSKTGTEVQAATYGIVVYSGTISMGGNVVLVLGPKWRLHYYAHLHDRNVGAMGLVKTGSKIGSVGATGNAAGKPPHLHYSIYSLVPLPWRIDDAPQGYRKAFFLNPIDFISN